MKTKGKLLNQIAQNRNMSENYYNRIVLVHISYHLIHMHAYIIYICPQKCRSKHNVQKSNTIISYKRQLLKKKEWTFLKVKLKVNNIN